MSRERLSMRKIKEVLRSRHELGLSHRAFAKSCGLTSTATSRWTSTATVFRVPAASGRTCSARYTAPT